MKIDHTHIAGVLVLTPQRLADARGWFSETWNARTLASLGIDIRFVQDNHSCSTAPGTVRGLHFQRPPHAQDKLVRVLRGGILDVAVDMRHGSPSYGKWTGVELSASNGRQLLVPAGCLHGFVTRAPDTEVIYKCSAHYAPGFEGTVRFDDPDIGIDWGIAPGQAILSDKDATAPLLKDTATPFSWKASD